MSTSRYTPLAPARRLLTISWASRLANFTPFLNVASSYWLIPTANTRSTGWACEVCTLTTATTALEATMPSPRIARRLTVFCPGASVRRCVTVPPPLGDTARARTSASLMNSRNSPTPAPGLAGVTRTRNSYSPLASTLACAGDSNSTVGGSPPASTARMSPIDCTAAVMAASSPARRRLIRSGRKNTLASWVASTNSPSRSGPWLRW